jgi:hypothetical protein
LPPAVLIATHVIEAVLNHVSGHKAGVAGIYNRSTYAAEKRAALDAWANHIRVILWNNVTVATATRTMTKTAPISTTKFTF